jgi:hypothetical protein
MPDSQLSENYNLGHLKKTGIQKKKRLMSEAKEIEGNRESIDCWMMISSCSLVLFFATACKLVMLKKSPALTCGCQML